MKTLFQSQKWAEFQEAIGRKCWIIENIVIIKHSLPFGLSFFECGISVVPQPFFFKKIETLAKEQKAIFLRLNSSITKDQVLKLPPGFKKTPHSHFPQGTTVIDLTKSEEQILNEMKPKGRYNIRLAQRHGVTVRESNIQDEQGKKDLKQFYELLKQTSSRDGFQIHTQKYYQKMLEVLGPKHCKLFLAEVLIREHGRETSIVAGAIGTFYEDTALYYYGASSYKHRQRMAPYLLHWEIMKYAKSQGYKKYDLFGIAPEGIKNHPWSGVTEFKKKFGGHIVEYHQAVEKHFQKSWYLLYKLAKYLRTC